MELPVRKLPVFSFEGGEGSGKSTVARMLRDRFRETNTDLVLTREPGGVAISEVIRDVIFGENHDNMSPVCEAMLFAAARNQHLIELIFPLIEEEKMILMDRYVDSSYVYQGYVLGVGYDAVKVINDTATYGFYPDITFLLDIDPAVGLARIAANSEREINRNDTRGIEWHHNIRKAYLDVAARYPDRFICIDTHRPVEEVVDIIYHKMSECLITRYSNF